MANCSPESGDFESTVAKSWASQSFNAEGAGISGAQMVFASAIVDALAETRC